MTQTSTSTISTAKYSQSEGISEPLSDDEESFYSSINHDLDKLIKEPRTETIEAILKFSRGERS